MSRFGERVRVLRIKHNLTQAKLADDISKSMGKDFTRSALSNYELGLREPDLDTVEAFADYFDTSISDILGRDENEVEQKGIIPLPANVTPISDLHQQRVPMIGEVAAGEPIYGEEIGLFVNAPIECDAAVTIKGDSMAPNYLPGDVVYIKCVPNVPEGAVAVVFLDDEAVIKHVYRRKTGLTLWSDNPEYMPMQIEFDDYNMVRIFGVPVGYTRIFKPEIKSKIRKGFH